jgi:hypothetical protein
VRLIGLIAIVMILAVLWVPVVPAQKVQWSNGHYYEAVYVPNGIKWDQAYEQANKEGGHLVTISSKEENDFVYSLISNDKFWHKELFNGEQPWWIGPWLGAYRTDGDLRWVTGEPFTYEHWVNGQPDNYGGKDNYVLFDTNSGTKDSTWDDVWDTWVPYGYIVEWDLGRQLDWIIIKRLPILKNGERDGHWWIEVYLDQNGKPNPKGNKVESYGWYPTEKDLNPSDILGIPEKIWNVYNGVPGELNGQTAYGGTATRDPHQGQFADEQFHPYCNNGHSDEEILSDIRAFAESYTGIWSFPGHSCHDFQESMMKYVGLDVGSSDTSQAIQPPQSISECEKGGSEICGTWTLALDGDYYNARWANGATGTLKIASWGPNDVVLSRLDPDGFQGLYTGTLDSGRITDGRVVWKSNGGPQTGTWIGTWGDQA